MKSEYSKKSIYDERPFGEFNYNRDKIYERDILGTFLLKRIRPTDLVAEIGTGQGFILDFLAKNGINKDNLNGCDISKESVKIAYSKGYNVKIDDNTHLSYESDTFDVVISNGVIHHTDSYGKSFKEIVRITKPGGLIYLSIYDKIHPYSFFYFSCTPLKFFYHKVSRRVVNTLFYPVFRYLYLYPTVKLITGEGLDNKSAKTLFYDQILTPIARFRSIRTIKRYINESGCKLLVYRKEKGGQMTTYVFEKHR